MRESIPNQRLGDELAGNVEGVREIPLSRGFVARVDVTDYEDLSRHKWYALVLPDRVYAARKAYKPRERGRQRYDAIPMASQILGLPIRSEFVADHINGDSLDNRRANLRRVTTRENNLNRTRAKNNRSGRTGVYWHIKDKRWIAHITLDGITHRLGSFIDKEAAVAAREAAEQQMFGEFLRKGDA